MYTGEEYKVVKDRYSFLPLPFLYSVYGYVFINSRLYSPVADKLTLVAVNKRLKTNIINLPTAHMKRK